MTLYVIENINPNRDRYFGSNTGGDFIKSPGTRQYHTSIEKATYFKSLLSADKCVKEMISYHTSMTGHARNEQFALAHEMTHDTCPDLKVRAIMVTPRELNSTENAALKDLD